VLGEPEVAQEDALGGPARDQHVGGLDVAVEEPARVGEVERRADLRDDARGARGLEPPVARDQRLQVGALDPAHGDVELAVLLARVVDGDDVGVVERGDRAQLALEALAVVGLEGVVGRDQLERDGAPERELGGAVDDAHAAPPRHRVEAIAREDRARRALHRGSLTPPETATSRMRPDGLAASPCGPYHAALWARSKKES
jgi:hypothetical protein